MFLSIVCIVYAIELRITTVSVCHICSAPPSLRVSYLSSGLVSVSPSQQTSLASGNQGQMHHPAWTIYLSKTTYIDAITAYFNLSNSRSVTTLFVLEVGLSLSTKQCLVNSFDVDEMKNVPY